MASILYHEKTSLSKDTARTSKLAEAINQRAKELADDRKNWETMWEKITKHVAPDSSLLFGSNEEGDAGGQDLYDGTGIYANNTWADGMQGRLLSRAGEWFGMALSNAQLNDLMEIKEYLHELEKHFYRLFRNTNFYGALGPYFRHAGSFCTASMYIEDVQQMAKINFNTCHPMEIFLADGPGQKADTVFRKYDLSYKLLGQEFGEENLDDETRNMVKTEPHKKTSLIHACFHKSQGWAKEFFGSWSEGMFVPPEQRPVASINVLPGKNIILREAGFDINRYVVWRPRRNPNESYGRGPGTASLKDVLVLNSMAESLLRAGQLAADPPWNIPEEMKNKARISPRGMNYYDETARQVTAIDAIGNYPIALEQEEKRREIIRRHYFTEFFTLLNMAEREMTAFEVDKRLAETAVLLSPMIGTLESDFLNPLFDVVYDIEEKAGRLPPPPQILVQMGEQDIEIDYLGTLSRMQKRLHRTQGPLQATEILAPYIAARPEIADNLNWDAWARMILEEYGAPPEVLNDPRLVQAIRKARQQAQEEAENMAQTAEMADRVPALNQTVQKGSPLEAIIGKKAG